MLYFIILMYLTGGGVFLTILSFFPCYLLATGSTDLTKPRKSTPMWRQPEGEALETTMSYLGIHDFLSDHHASVLRKAYIHNRYTHN